MREADSNEGELIARCRRGERRAWYELVHRYDRFVFSVAKSTGLTTEDAADITQMTFSALLEGLNRLRECSRLAPWLATVARRQSWRLLAQRKREPTGSVEDVAWHVAETEPDTSDPIGRWERLHALTLALERLDRRCRDLISSLYLDPEEPTYREISTKFSLPEGSIGPTRARCLEKLRQIMIVEGAS